MENSKRMIDLIPGDTEPMCGIKIKELVIKSDTFVVYLNEKDEIYWATNTYVNMSADFGIVLNRVRELEMLNEGLFSGKDLNRYNYLVAEGVARLLDDNKIENAISILDDAEKKITLQGKNKNRSTYIISSLIFSLIIGLIIFLAFYFRNSVIGILNYNAYEIIMASLFGGIGAFLSAFFRSNKYEPDISLGKYIHILDGVLRNFYGCIAGLLVVLGIKANIIMGFLNLSEKSFIVICFISFIAGASESLVPSLIRQIEGKATE